MSSEFSQPAATLNPGLKFRTSLLLRNRFQLFGGIFVAVIVPVLLRSLYEQSYWASQINLKTMGASTAAIFLGFYLNRRMTNFPGVQANFYIAPIFVSCFAVFAFLFLLFREDYSRYLFFSAMTLSVIWFYGIHIFTRRLRPLKLSIVPAGNAMGLNALKGVNWSTLKQPIFPTERIDGIVVDLRSDLDEDWSRFITDAALTGMPVFHAKNVKESMTGRVEIDHLSENVFGSLVPGLLYLKLKLMMDRCAAALVLIPLLPFMAAIALLIKLENSGSVIFTQRRMGFRGKPFTMYKFRTMIDAPEQPVTVESEKTQDDDPRITKIGKWLRKHRMDELPQMVNIMKGEMSWIGPRPEAYQLSKSYEAELPYYRYRHIVRPGISGWAQVNQGHVAEVDDVHEKLYYDFYYIKHCSLWLDILITLRTIRTVVLGLGAK